MNKKHQILAASLGLFSTLSLWATALETTSLSGKEIFEPSNLQEQYRSDIMKMAFVGQFGEQQKPEELTWDEFFFQTLAQKNSEYVRMHQKLPLGDYGRYFQNLNLEKLRIEPNIFQSDFDRNFQYTDFSRTNLVNSRFYLANFITSNFSNADLTNAQWDHVKGQSINFSHAKMINMRIFWSDFSKTNLSNANLAFTVLDNVKLTEALVNNTNFKDASYKDEKNNVLPITLKWLEDRGALWDKETPPIAH